MKSIQLRINRFSFLVMACFFSMMIFEGCITSYKNNKGVEIKTTLSPSEEFLYQLFQNGMDSGLHKDSIKGVILTYDSVGVEIVSDSLGSKNGEAIVFCRNGNIIRGMYENNEQNGLWAYYDKNLNIFKTVEYMAGKRTRQWIYFEGKVVRGIIYSPKW